MIVGVCNTVYMCACIQDRMPVASATQFLMLIREYNAIDCMHKLMMEVTIRMVHKLAMCYTNLGQIR